jgi:type VI protein secretion system component VasF
VRERGGSAPPDLANEAERAHTPRTPFRALAGVWLAVAIVVAIVIALVVVALSVWS